MGFRLFISHSTPEPDLPRLEALVAAIESAAGDDPINVIYDKQQITGGDEWRRRIAFMLHACDAAVVVLDENARNSDWVLTEAIFLSLRQQVDPAFRFIPVSFLPPSESTADSLDAKAARAAERAKFGEGTWRVVDLGRIQQARGASPEQVGSLVVDALRVNGRLVSCQSPVDRLALQLVRFFDGVSSGLLEPIVDAFGPDITYLTADQGPTRAATAIARHLIGTGRLPEIRDALDDLGIAITDPARRAILKALAPLPLDANAAALLTRQRPNRTGYVHASITTTQPHWTVTWYIARANLARRTNVMPLNNADASYETLRVDLRRTWRQHNPEFSGFTDAQVDQQLRSTRCYVTIPGLIDADVLRRLDDEYPAISFVMFDTGSSAPLPPTVVELIPRLEPDREMEMIGEYAAAIANLG